MTPLLIRSLDIDAPILAEKRRVTYADGVLALHVPADQIEYVLALLAGVDPAGRNPCRDIPAPTDIGPRGPAVPKPAPVVPAASPEVAAIVAAAYSPPADDPALEFPPRGASMEMPSAPTPLLTPAEIASAPAPHAAVEAPAGGVTDTLRGATKLAEVVAYLVEQQGIRELDALVAECQRLAPEVPLLGKIANLPTRIERTLSVLGLA
jgi:hypothetical protein